MGRHGSLQSRRFGKRFPLSPIAEIRRPNVRLAFNEFMPNEVNGPVTVDEDDPPRARALRDHLVEQIVAAGVRDTRVLGAMRAVPRHLFVPQDELENAYADQPLNIGYAATISQPSLVAIMSEALALTGTEHVLEIGTGSGYQAAVLGHLAGSIETVEVVPALAERAAATLIALGYRNVHVHTADGWAGWIGGAPYDRIVVTAAPEVLPHALLAQLVDGGLLIAPVGPQARDQRLECWRKLHGHLHKQDLGAVRFVPMVHGPS